MMKDNALAKFISSQTKYIPFKTFLIIPKTVPISTKIIKNYEINRRILL